MDDGSLGYHSGQEDRANLAMNDFDENSVQNLINAFKKFNIFPKMYNSNGWRLRFNCDEAEKLFLLIAPYMPKCMRYKLPRRYRDGDGWLPKINNEYKSDYVQQEILEITPFNESLGKYDLKTTTHNFFANGILVHNSSANIGWKEKQTRYFSGGCKHATFVKLFDEEKLIEKFTEIFGDESVTIYGEAYGGKLQGMSKTYGLDLKFIVFDVKVGDTWVSVPNAHDIATKLGLEFVDYKEIETNIDMINECRDAPSTQAIRNGMGDDKEREGVVLRPLEEYTSNNGQRVMAKHKGDSFMETATKREVSPEQLKMLTEGKKIANEWVTPMRLSHILDKLDVELDMKNTSKVIKAMFEDILREAEGEIEMSKAAQNMIGRKTAELWKKKISKI